MPTNSGLVISTAGAVGIGTVNPVSGRLHVVNGSTAIYGTSTDSYGVYGQSTKYFGLYGLSTNSVGVYGKSNAVQTAGVVGVSPFEGVHGEATGSNPDAAGVYGKSPASGWAGFFDGKLGVQSGLIVANGGCDGCSPPSDRSLKENFLAVNPRFILDRLAQLPIQTWNYKRDSSSVRHIGAMAQDFRAAFNLGEDDRTLNTVDAQGVTMAAIQGLYQLMQEKDRQIERLQAQLNQVRRALKHRRAARR